MAVIRVDDLCRSRASERAVVNDRREAADEPGFRHVRVDDVGTDLAEDGENREECP